MTMCPPKGIYLTLNMRNPPEFLVKVTQETPKILKAIIIVLGCPHSRNRS